MPDKYIMFDEKQFVTMKIFKHLVQLHIFNMATNYASLLLMLNLLTKYSFFFEYYWNISLVYHFE